MKRTYQTTNTVYGMKSRSIFWGKAFNGFVLFVVIFSLLGFQHSQPVQAQAEEICVASRISASADDVEERNDTGAVDLDGDTTTKSLQTFRAYGGGSSGTLNWWGLRFLNLDVPPGVTITSAKVTFRANASSGSSASGMTLWGQLAANPSTFTTSSNNVTSRDRTTASIEWSIDPWTNAENYDTPNLSAVIQEIVNQPSWVAGNAMVIIGQTTVSQNRSAISYNSTDGPSLAPILEVCYTLEPIPTISPSGVLSEFSAATGEYSAEQNYAVSGINLDENITITPPADFEISLTSGSGFVANPGSITLTQDEGVVESTDIFVRFKRASAGTSTGSIIHVSTGATQKDLAVTGVAKDPLGAWIAYNDCAGDNSIANTTNILGVSGSGTLKDFDTGESLPVTATFTSSGSPAIRTSGGPTASGTDAYESFNGKANMTGVVQYGSSGWYVDLTFTGLDPVKTYTFATSANRDSSDYEDERLTRFTISNVDSAINDSTSGVIEDGAYSVAFSTGFNTVNGYVARWTEIKPGLDGGFTVRAEAYSSEVESYAFSVFMLAEEMPSGPNISLSGTLAEFAAETGVYSAEQSYAVAGSNLEADITITPPADFEISLTSGSGFVANPGSITLTQDEGVVESTDIFVRFKRASAGTSTGSIIHISTGATQKDLAVTGVAKDPMGAWVAYNDMVYISGQPESNITKFTIPDEDFPSSGVLVDYATGEETPVTATITASNINFQTDSTYFGAETASGTEAYEMFHDIVDMRGLLQYSSSSSSWNVEIKFTGLDPAKTYSFATTANRDDSGYDARITRFSISGADDAVNASTEGVTVVDNDAVAFSTGNNTANGYVARWTGINPGSDGEFIVRAEPHTSENRAYGFSVFMLAEEAPSGPTITTSTNSLSPFFAQPGEISAAQTYTVSGSNLTEDITITAPNGFGLSLDDNEFNSQLILPQTEGTVPPTTIYVALYSEGQGTFGGNITHISEDAITKTISVEGSVANQICYYGQEFVAAADTYISQYNNTYNYGVRDYMRVTLGTDSNNPRASLIQWDLNAIPAEAVLLDASMQLNVSTTGSAQYNLYQMQRAWSEGSGEGSETGDGATWDTTDGTTAWGAGGAASTSEDRYDVNLWDADSSSFSTTGNKSVSLNANGLAVIQEWVAETIPNYGFTIQNYISGSTDVQFSTRDHATEANRPKLVLDYCIGDVDLFTLSVDNVGNGTVNLAPSGGTYISGSIITLTPEPGFDYEFSHWSGDDVEEIQEEAGVFTILMDSDKSVVANFTTNEPPESPVLVQPVNQAEDVSTSPLLEVGVTDPEGVAMEVSFYGREAGAVGGGEEFTFIVLPDTQMASQSYPEVFNAMTQWVVDETENRNIVFATHVGDIVQTANNTTEWQRADAAMGILDTAGVPYSVGPGNHDLAIYSSPSYYNTYFGPDRFAGYDYYQGPFATGENENNYSFFSASGIDFIVINLQYNSEAAHWAWADGLLKANPDRLGIVAQHNILNVDNSWQSTASENMYNELADNPNLFLMVCGHMHSASDGSAYRLETRTGMQPVHILLTDYQDYTSGGNGWLRILTFKPAVDQIYAQIYSPYIDDYLTNEANYEQFTMSFEMEGSAPFELIGTATGIPSGTNASVTWSGLDEDTAYEWYAEAYDGKSTTTSDVWQFTTGVTVVNEAPVLNPIGDKVIDELSQLSFMAIATDDGLPGGWLNFYLDGDVPSGASIGLGGLFTWTPTEAQGPDDYTFEVCVTDTEYEDCEEITVTVNEVNHAPVLGSVGNKSVVEKSELTFTATATDPDIPANMLTFGLENGDAGSVPAGASIVASTGLFSWTPDSDGTFTFDVCVSDGALEDCETITVTVTEAGIPPDVSAYHGEIHFMAGDNGPVEGDFIDAYRDDESTSSSSAVISFDEPSSALVYSIDVEKESGGTPPQNITFKIGNRVVATSDWESMRSKHLDIHPPKADAGGPYAVLLEDGTVTLAGSATDWLADDTFSYAWDFDGDGEFDDASNAAPDFSFTTADTYEVGLRVTDTQGGEGHDTAQVFVVELSGLEGQVYDGDPHAVTVVGVESPYTYTVLYGSPGSETAPTNAGTYQITVVIKEGEVPVAEIESQLVISPKPLTVTANAQSKVYGDDDPALTYTVPDGSLIGSDAVTGALGRAEGENVGTYVISQGSLSAGDNYTITFNSADLTITPKPITVTADVQSKVYGEGDPELTYTLSEGSLVGEDVITGDLDRANGEDVGTYAISQGSLSAGSNYTITFVPADLIITPRLLTVKADAKSKVFGEDDPELTYSVTQGSLVNGDDFSGALVREPGEEVGVYEITQGDLTAGDNYAISFESASLTITLMSVTVTADSNQTKVYGEEDPVFTFTASEPLAFTGALSRVTGEDVGSYTIEIGDLSAGSNYTINFVSADFTITPKPITVTADDKTKGIGEDDPELTYQITEGSLTEGDEITGALTRESGEDAGEYDIQQGTLALSSNYTLTFIEGTLTILQEKHGIDLVAGWNLVSFSIHPTDTEIEEVLSSIDGLYTLVYAWDATTDSWLKFDPNVGYGRTLTDLDETMGFWICMTADATLEVQGASPGLTEIALGSGGGGWNLVGFPSTATLELPGALEDHGVGDAYTIVFAYKAPDTADPWKLYEPGAPGYASDLTHLEAGWGYWIKVTEDVVWQVEY